ncbi:MAG TPA: hypothetical protein VD838_13560, partial [Anaeromyxobacteraceae bacterium]|nr:hypothetical protein [Anaeromyxobacteraceae bacterium]
LTALAALALASSASAAEVTRIASSGDRGDPLDVDFQIRLERQEERGRIVFLRAERSVRNSEGSLARTLTAARRGVKETARAPGPRA